MATSDIMQPPLNSTIGFLPSPFASMEVQKSSMSGSESGSGLVPYGEENTPVTAEELRPQRVALEKAATMSELREALDGIAETYSEHVALQKFKREAGKAWLRHAPEEMKQPSTNSFQMFIKENIASVRTVNPSVSHKEHMQILGKMWSETKSASMMTRFHKDVANMTGHKRALDDI